MFTGIIEQIGEIVATKQEHKNMIYEVSCKFPEPIKIDQSISHNGICLTVVAIIRDIYTVVAIDETIQKTTISDWQAGDTVNIERAAQVGSRLDGHMVQGHIDTTAQCIDVVAQEGSHIFTFVHDTASEFRTVEKGSITINGISLTVINSKENQFSVAIIPYTFEHTNFKNIKKGTQVNLEFDIIGKYIQQHLKLYLK